MFENIFYLVPISAIIALIFAFIFYFQVMKKGEGKKLMKEIAGYVREGAYTYLRKQYKVVAIVFAILFVIFVILAKNGTQNPFVPVAFLTGGLFSGICGYIGMKTATNASSRVANGCRSSLNEGLKIAFRSGAVMGLVVVGFGLLDISLWYLILDKLIYTIENMSSGIVFLGVEIIPKGMDISTKLSIITTTMITFGMGASTQALFARVGGGIFTKAADVGADNVGKVESGLPEDSPLNPGTIADNVGDNVGDVAGMGADLYESYCGSILATMAIAASLGLNSFDSRIKILVPMLIAAVGIISSIVGVFLVRSKEDATQKNLLKSMLVGTMSSSILVVIFSYFLVKIGFITIGIFGSIVTGLMVGVILGQITEYYTSSEYCPTQALSSQAKNGAANIVIAGFATGKFSVGYSVITVVFGIMFAFAFAGGFQDYMAGLYGISLAAVGMLSTLGITLATDAYGPIADNAGGNAEMCGLPAKVRERTDALDALGNTTAATGKGFAIGSAALTSLALVTAYLEEIKIWIGKFANEGGFELGNYNLSHSMSMQEIVQIFNLSILNPKLICGILVGGALAFVFSALTMQSVGKVANEMVEEIRRQIRDLGILEGKNKPDHTSCIEIATAGAQREMVTPSLMALIVPIVVGLLLGVAGVIGLLVGTLSTGFVLAIAMNNAGGCWDNAKKHIENGNHGGKGSDAHKASVIGDTVGDPFKDTSGPSINILIKLVVMSSIVFCGVVVKYSAVIGQWLGIGF